MELDVAKLKVSSDRIASSKTHSRRSRGRSSVRTRFLRYVWSFACLLVYLIVWVFFLGDFETPGSDFSIVILLVGALVTAIAGALLAPVLQRFLQQSSQYH